MVHPLGGRRGPARTMACFLQRVADTWQVDAAAPEGLVLSTGRAARSVRTCCLPLYGSRPASWLAGTTTIYRFASEAPPPDLVHANGLSALNLVAPFALRHRVP